MTEKLYYKDAYLSYAVARIEKVLIREDGIAIAFDRTVFFPCGGGQPSDTGYIIIKASSEGISVNDVNCTETDANCTETCVKYTVTDVYEEDGVIYHVCGGVSSTEDSALSLKAGDEAELFADVPRRTDLMKQHTAEHMLSYTLKRLYGAVNVGFHMNFDFATCDFDIPLSWEQLLCAEEEVNRDITLCKSVYDRVYPESEADALPLRKRTEKLHGALRVVYIDGNDSCTCCGLHVSNTGQIGLMKIISSERLRGGTRIYFLCGERALRDYGRKSETVSRLSAMLSSKQDEVAEAVGELEGKNSELKRTLGECSRAIASFLGESAERRNGILLSVSHLPGEKVFAEAAQAAVRLPAEGLTRAVIYRISPERIGYAFCRESKYTEGPDCAELCRRVNELLKGKGGGKSDHAQASAPFEGDIDSAAELLRKIF